MSGLFNQASLVLVPSGYKAGKVYSQVPTSGDGDLTFTRASDSTRVNSDGLIEIPRTNLLLRSEEFNNAAWVKGNLTITENNVVSPDGTQNADLLSANGVNSPHIAYQSCSITSGTSYALSCFIKKGTNNYAQVIGGTNAFGPNVWANFDLNNGVVGSIGSSTTASITSVGDGWYRCVIIGTAIATGSNPSVVVAIVPSSTSTRGEASTLTTNIFAWGAQLEVGSTATEYIPTTTSARTTFAGITQDGTSASNVPRLDYSQGSCPALLLEPQRTNLALYSEQFDNAVWVKSNATVTANTLISPDGYINADKIIPNTDPLLHQFRRTISGITAQSYTMSIFAKKGGYNFIRFWEDGQTGKQSYYNLDTGVATNVNMDSVGIEDYGDGWFRCTATVAIPASGVFGFRVLVTPDGSQNSFIGNDSDGVFVYGAQLEQGAYATSYIPTTSATVTRLADSCSKTGISSLIGQTQGTIYLDTKYSSLGSTAFESWFRVYGASDIIGLAINGANLIRSIINGKSDTLSTAAPRTNTGVKIAWAYNASGVVLFVNGVQYALPNGGAEVMSSLDSILFDASVNAFFAEGTISQALLFPTRLSNSELQSLTTL